VSMRLCMDGRADAVRTRTQRMNPIKVNPIGDQPLQACLDATDHGLVIVVDLRPFLIAGGSIRKLGCQHHVVTAGLDRPANDLLRLPCLIAIGCVNEVSAGVNVRVHNALRFRRRSAIAAACSKHSAPERQFGNPQTCAASEELISHELAP
jgi:hypothetical protein